MPAVPSISWVRLQFWPANPYTERAIRYTGLFNVMFGIQLQAIDHDFHLFGIVPSVAFFIDVPDNASDSFFRGATFVTNKDKVTQPSSALRHSAEMNSLIRLNYDGIHPLGGTQLRGRTWVAYDRQYRREALARKDLNWSATNSRLYNEAFTGCAKAIPRCCHCEPPRFTPLLDHRAARYYKVGPVNYHVQLIGGTQKRVVHRNRLKPCLSDPEMLKSRIRNHLQVSRVPRAARAHQLTVEQSAAIVRLHYESGKNAYLTVSKFRREYPAYTTLCRSTVLRLVSKHEEHGTMEDRLKLHCGMKKSSFSMNEYGSLESMNLRSPDNQSLRQSLTARTRAVLQTLDGMPETTETSSISGSVEMDLDMERLKVYRQALRSNVYHLVSTLIPVDGLKGLDTVKNPDKVKDCEQADGSTHHILDLEEVAKSEELCKVREERAEMKSQLYMMAHEKRRMELDVCHFSLLVKQYKRVIQDLRAQLNLNEEKESVKRREKGRVRKLFPFKSVVFFRRHHVSESTQHDTLKRLATRTSLQRIYQDQILTVLQLYQFAVSTIRGMHFGFVTLREHKEEAKLLEERLILSRTVPGTHTLHSVVPVGGTIVEVKPYSNSASSRNKSTTTLCPSITPLSFSAIGRYVTVAYDGSCWLGYALNVNEQERAITVTFLRPSIPISIIFLP
eukprot:Em0004g1045a